MYYYRLYVERGVSDDIKENIGQKYPYFNNDCDINITLQKTLLNWSSIDGLGLDDHLEFLFQSELDDGNNIYFEDSHITDLFIALSNVLIKHDAFSNEKKAAVQLAIENGYYYDSDVALYDEPEYDSEFVLTTPLYTNREEQVKKLLELFDMLIEFIKHPDYAKCDLCFEVEK